MTRSLPTARAALAGAALMVAQQVAAKSLRDAVFLAHHPVTALPAVLVASAALSIALAFALAGPYARHGPRRVVPLLCAASVALLAVFAALLGPFPRFASAGVYVQVSVIGTALLSGFWLQVSEALDPRSARRSLGAIGAAGALGGIAGGALGTWAAGGMGAGGAFLAVALLQALSAAASRALSPVARSAERPASARDALSGLSVLRRHGYLRAIGALLALSSLTAALLDYLFKAHAVAAFAPDERLRVFSTFYAAASALTFLTQIALGGPLLRRAGLGPTLATLPLGLGAGAAALALAPGFASAALARGLDTVLRSSLFRAGYEQLFTPLETTERRATKGLLDVGFDRVGDALGGTLVALLLLLGPRAAPAAMAWSAFALAAGALALALRLPRGYVAALETGLARGVVAADPARAADRTTRNTMALTLAARGLDLAALRAAAEPGAARTPVTSGRLAALRSGEKYRVRVALAPAAPLTPDEVRAAAELLARDEFAAEALAALREAAAHDARPVIAALADPTLDAAARRRVARALSTAPPAEAAAALLAGLSDERFEVRFACGRALARLHVERPGTAVPADAVFAAVVREARRGRAVTDAARAGDDAPGEGDALLGAELRIRAQRALELCFTLLLVATPREPLRVAWKALQTDDPVLRGTALEYLESALPPEVRDALWPHLEAPDRAPAARTREAAVENLLRSHPSIVIRLGELRARDAAPGREAGPGA